MSMGLLHNGNINAKRGTLWDIKICYPVQKVDTKSINFCEDIVHLSSAWQTNSSPRFLLIIVFINFGISCSLNVYNIPIPLRRKRKLYPWNI